MAHINRSFVRMRVFILLMSLTLLVPAPPVPVHAAPRTAPPAIAPAARAAIATHSSVEVLVILQAQAKLPTLPAYADKATRGRIIVRVLQTYAKHTQAPLRDWLESQAVSYRAFYIVNALLIEADGPLLDELAARPEIAAITTNPAVVAPLAIPEPEPAAGSLLVPAQPPWGIEHIGAPKVWALGYRGQRVVVAGQDTGYDWSHPALKSQYRGWDGITVDHDYNWHDAIHATGGLCPADSPEPCDDHGHGTHTMGTIVGQAPGDTPIGVAPGAQWIGCRNMHRGIGTPASYAECFEFFLAPYPVGGTPEEGEPARAPHVINNSWACTPAECTEPEHIPFLEGVVNAVRAAGIMVVASAGNSGPACDTVLHPPAIYSASTTVGATDDEDNIAFFSSRGDAAGLQKPQLTAPGVSVHSSTLGGGYATLQGTSMAAPHVTGAAALLWSARPDLRGNVAATELLLTSTAVPLTSSECGSGPDALPNPVYGWGRLDALAAIEAGLPILRNRLYFPLLIREADKVHCIP